MENEIVQDALICSCSSAEHQVILSYFIPDTEATVYAAIHLQKRPFWARLKYAFKYIFGYKCSYGAFDEVLFGPEHVDKLQAAIDHIRNTNEELKRQALKEKWIDSEFLKGIKGPITDPKLSELYESKPSQLLLGDTETKTTE
jgi:hypothetical protein